jgi:Fe-S oxidoreductase
MDYSAENFVNEYKLLECIQCGVCTGGCPVSVKSDLNIRKMMRDIRLKGSIDIPADEILWSCTICSTCEARCPKELTPFDVIIGMRGINIEKGRVTPTIRNALESIFKHGNPWDRSRNKRSDWAQGLNVKPFDAESDLLYYVGCTPAYDPRGQEVARAIVKILEAARINFGTLENDESCCGDIAFSMGETGLFELLVEDNNDLFERVGFNHMITTSPHCFNAFKNRYGKVSFDAQHYTLFVEELIDSGRLEMCNNLDCTVAFHDPCFLGRQNEIYDQPRKILESIPGIKLVELDRSRERSLCCEGGGGRMWVDVPGEKLAERRIKNAVEIGAEVLVTSCPFCTSTFEDAVLTTGYENKVKVMDIAELIAQSI